MTVSPAEVVSRAISVSVLRSAADELDSIPRITGGAGDAWDCGHNSGLDRAANKLRAMAHKLEAQP